jgi:hypothetical protein
LRSRSSSATRVEPVSPLTQAAALAYLDRSPYLNVFLAHILGGDFTPSFHKNVALASDDGEVTGVAYCGRQIVIAAGPRAIPALAVRLTRGPVRQIIGERETIASFWPLVASRFGRPRLVRERQLVMAVTPTTLIHAAGNVTVRHATVKDARAVAESSASMIAHELEYDPRSDRTSFDIGVRQMIERRLWWVGESSGRICFFCNIGPWSNRTAQLQGIWTPPELRGRGLATAALGAICGRLFEVFPTLSLYVNDFNERAVALYRRLGFQHVGDFTSVLL